MEDLYLIDIVESLLKRNSIYIERREIYKTLLSNPYYPSLASVSSTLTSFGLDNESYLSDIDHLSNYKNVVIHSKEQEGHFYILKDIDRNIEKVVLYDGKKKVISKNEFIELWDGIMLVTTSHVYKKSFVDVVSRINIVNVIIAICLLSFMFVQNVLSTNVILDILALVFIAILKNQHVFEYKEYPFCKIGKRIDCKYVSSVASFDKISNVDLTMIGAFFFFSDIIFFIDKGIVTYIIVFSYFCAAFVMLCLTIFQFFVIKKYCVYCCAIALIVFIKLIIAISLPINKNELGILEYVWALSLAYLLVVLYSKYKETQRILLKKELSLLKIKRTPKVLAQMLESYSGADSISKYALFYGKGNAEITITTIISLDCPYCKRVIKDVYNLMVHNPHRFSWKIIIAEDGDINMNHKDFINHFSRQKYLYQIYKFDKDKCMQTLLRRRKYIQEIQFTEKAIEDYRNILKDVRLMKIQHFPTILVNNYLLPTEYDISDLQFLSMELCRMNENFE